jgi:hypothetical protein
VQIRIIGLDIAKQFGCELRHCDVGFFFDPAAKSSAPAPVASHVYARNELAAG